MLSPHRSALVDYISASSMDDLLTDDLAQLKFRPTPAFMMAVTRLS